MTEGVAIENLSSTKPLAETQTCLEFLILSMCSSLSLKPRHAISLFAHDFEYLKKLFSRGLKGDFGPIQVWYQTVYAESDRLASLLQQKPEDLPVTLSALGQGLRSPDDAVQQWTCRLLSKLSFDLEEHAEALWKWLTATAVHLLVPLLPAESAVDVMIHYSHRRLYPLFTEVLPSLLPLPHSYLSFMLPVLETLFTSTATVTDLKDSGVTRFLRDMALHQAESLTSECRLTSLLVVRCILQQEQQDSSIEAVLKRGMHDRVEIIRTTCTVILFETLETLVTLGHPHSLELYKALALKVGTEVTASNTNYILLSSFRRLVAVFSELPLAPLLDILTPKYHKSTWIVTDIELLQVLVSHSNLALPQAVQLLDCCAHIYFCDYVYAQAAYTLITTAVQRYIHCLAMQEYAVHLSKFLLKTTIEEHRKIHIRLIKWLLKFKEITEKVQSSLIESYNQLKGKKSNAVKELMKDIGYAPVPVETNTQEPVSKPQSLQKALLALEKIKQQRQAKLLIQQNSALQLLSDTQKRTKRIRQQLEIRRVEQGLCRGVPQDAAAIYPFESVASAAEEAVSGFNEEDSMLLQVVCRKYRRVLKTLFVKYSGTGFAIRQEPGFQWLAQRKTTITEAEILKILSIYQIVPFLLTKEEFRTLLRSYCAKIAQQHDLTTLDFTGFAGIFPHLAGCIATKGYAASWPPALQLQQLMLHMRKHAQGIDLDLFDESDPGTGDKEVVKRLNQQLKLAPEAELPGGYRVVEEQVVEADFRVPECVEMSISCRVSLEVLDSLLNVTLGIHVLEPLVRVTTRKCAKGVKQKEPDSPPKQNSVLSPSMRFELAKLPAHLKPQATECAQILENLLLSVSLGLTRVIHRTIIPRLVIKPPASEPELRKIKDKIHWQRRKHNSQQRMLQYMQAKQEKLRLEQETEAQKQLEKAEEMRRLAQRAAREKALRVKQLQEWYAQKETLQNASPDLNNTEKKKQDKEKYKQMRNKLQAEMQVKLEQRRKSEENKLREIQKVNEEKQAVQQKTAKILALTRVKSQEKSLAFQRFANSPAVQEVLKNHQKCLQTLYDYFLKRVEFRLEDTVGLRLRDYAKVAVMLEIVPKLVSADSNATVFKTVTKGKAAGMMQYTEFIQALLHTAEVAREKLNSQTGLSATELQTETVLALLRFLHAEKETDLLDHLKTAEMRRRKSQASTDLALTERSQTRLRRALSRSKSARRALK